MYEKMRIIGLGSLLFLVLGVNAEGIRFEELSLDEALEKAKAENKLVFIDVFATWCGPCKYLSKEVFVDDQLGSYINENFVSIKIDGEAGEGPQLMQDYRLDAFPTMLMLTPERELRKKIVGAASADIIIYKANEAVNPENTAIYKLKQRFDKGERSRELLSDYLTELNNEGFPSDEIVDIYFESFPELDLEKTGDFIVYANKIDDLDNPNTLTFLSNIERMKELHGDIVDGKMSAMITGLVYNAVMNEDEKSITSGLDKLYEPYKKLFGEYAFDKEKLHSVMIQSYQENVQSN